MRLESLSPYFVLSTAYARTRVCPHSRLVMVVIKALGSWVPAVGSTGRLLFLFASGKRCCVLTQQFVSHKVQH